MSEREPRVTLADARAAGYCAAGLRAWCVRYGFDWSVARRQGLPLEAVRATGDAMAQRLCARAEQRGGA